ncbi:hypothetical protein [Streptomyces sp. NPDC001502]|uniref:hypothetical protein n=1 Tax=Streptomyces sp. NPDC001502 TaxID=3364578 RepID=UPI003691DEEA
MQFTGKSVAAAAAATAVAAVLSMPTGAVAEQRSEPVSFEIKRNTSSGSHEAQLLFYGSVTWNGEGNRTYTVRGTLEARCTTGSRTTAWLQYAANSESWKESREVECSDSVGMVNELPIEVTGTVRPGDTLAMRLGSWKFSSWVYSERKDLPHPAA